MHLSIALCAVVGLLCVTGLPMRPPQPSDIVFEVIPDEGYYFFNPKGGNWSEAFAYCQSQGAHLAMIDSPADAEAIVTMMANYTDTVSVIPGPVRNIHIGFHDQYVEGVYMDLNDNPVDENNSPWAPGSPIGSTSRNCGGFSAAGITDIGCEVRRSSFCELRKWDQYELIPGHGMYNYHSDKRTWAQAWQICYGEGGHLVVINTPEELEALKAMYPGWTDVWVGVHRMYGNDLFTTVLNKPLTETGFSKWLEFYPYGDSTSRPYVVAKHTGEEVGLWTFTPTGQLQFICEHAIV